MSSYNTYEKMYKLMSSYVPEFSYAADSDDPGSVLSVLCAGMIENSGKRYDKIIPKHKIQYLNLFDNLKREPVAAAKGYVQFHPIEGYEGQILVPKKTQVMGTGDTGDDIIFETMHDMAATIGTPQWIINTDKKADRITLHPYAKANEKEFKVFDTSGKNESVHELYLEFDELFSYQNNLDFNLYVTSRTAEDQEKLLNFFMSQDVSWYILEPEGKVLLKPQSLIEGGIHFQQPNYIPMKTMIGQREGYYLVVEVKNTLPTLYMESVFIKFGRKDVVPDEIFVNGISESFGSIFPFGKPFGLYNEFAIESKEVFARKDAMISVEFNLDYRIHEELLDIPEVDLEFKTIMKKPKHTTSIRSAEVLADYVLWEYYSTTGWKRLMKEEHITAMFNGSSMGKTSIMFSCPKDMIGYNDDTRNGRVRATLVRAENVYKVPAIYKVPVISDLKLSYHYNENKQVPDYAFTKNGFENQDITTLLDKESHILPFFNKEHDGRCMYIGFDYSVAGMPTSIYFDTENYSDIPVDFSIEYYSDQGFRNIRVIDYTDGFLGAGNILLLIPKDMVKTKLYGYEGYFIRFINHNRVNKEYALPIIKKIYMNMAKISNVNVVTEHFYLDEFDEAVDIQLSGENLLRVEVWMKEVQELNAKWVLWERYNGFEAKGRSYTVDMVEGIVSFSKKVFANVNLSEEGPHIMVKHYNYTGAKANLDARKIETLKNQVPYISSVENPFPTYGGYDGYSEESAANMISSMLRTRNRAVTSKDYFDIISTTSFGVRQVKCESNIDVFGKEKPGVITIAVLIDEYEKGVHIFSEIKESIRKKLLKTSSILPLGKELVLTQPHFVKVSVRVWLEKENMDQAFELQNNATKIINDFIDPLRGGVYSNGWEMGTFPRISQITAWLRKHILDCSISKIVMTANVDGQEILVKEEFYDTMMNPFIMAVNGTHIVYIELTDN